MLIIRKIAQSKRENMKNTIKVALVLALVTCETALGQLSKAAKNYESSRQVQPTPTMYLRTSGLPLLVGASIIGVNTLFMSNPLGATLAIPASSGVAALTAFWISRRWENTLAGQEIKLQEELARHYTLSIQKEYELAAKLNKLNLLTDKQKLQLQARVLHAHEIFQNPSKMALLSNA